MNDSELRSLLNPLREGKPTPEMMQKWEGAVLAEKKLLTLPRTFFPLALGLAIGFTAGGLFFSRESKVPVEENSTREVVMNRLGS